MACMRNFPPRPCLYRTASSAVICLALVLSAVFTLPAQVARTGGKSKGPRATGLLQLPEKGKPRLIPICIMVDGRFFDAGIYKADPVPMALEGGTVYEAERTGRSIGLFTVRNVLQQQQTKAWIAEGDWLAAGAAPPKPTALPAESKPREEEEDKPPTLRRPSKNSAEKPSETKPDQAANPAPSASPSTTASGPPPSTTASGASPSATASPETKEQEDPNRPHLRRGVPAPSRAVEPAPKNPAKQTAAKPASPPAASTTKATIESVPAISDADGPEPRPYTYDMKPEEEQIFRKKMLALATTEISNQLRTQEEETTPAKRSKRAVKPALPNFEDVHLRVFDVATNNEPILVLTARAALPAPAQQLHATVSASWYITVVARSDFNGELRKLMATVTDDRHLDVTPRMEMIDAVDVDGDGRGEFLFREISDAGTAYIVYRVTPDRLWTLFESTASGH